MSRKGKSVAADGRSVVGRSRKRGGWEEEGGIINESGH